MSSPDRLPALVESDRILLRHWVRDDAFPLRMAVLQSLDHLRPWIAWAMNEPSSIEEITARIERWRDEWAAGGDSLLGLFVDGEVMGGAGLHRRAGPGTLEIGYWVHADHVRRGYASETAAALTTAALATDGVAKVEIHHDKANVASEGIPRKLGYERVGEFPQAVVAPAEIGIEVRWAMGRERWQALRKQ